MYWPTPQDYNESIQNPEICLGDSELKTAKVEQTSLGLPRAITGAFASVYKLTCGKSSWAVRCFLTHREDQHARYQKVSEFITFDNLESTVQFRYLDRGIKVRGTWYPILKMDWVEGDTLDLYVAKNYKNKKKMEALAAEFRDMVNALNESGIAHGDLQHGNIIVAPGGLRLVDYDALYVPALSGLSCPELGHKNYQHPRRSFVHFGDYLDNFSAWAIYISLFAISIDPDIFILAGGGDDCLLFKRADFMAPSNSQVFSLLVSHGNEQIRQLSGHLLRMLNCAPEVVPKLNADEHTLASLPQLETLWQTDHHDDREEGALASIDQLAAEQVVSMSRGRLGKFGRLLSAHSDRLVRNITKRMSTMNLKATETIGSLVVRTAPDLWVAVLIDQAKEHMTGGDTSAAIAKYGEALEIQNTIPQPNRLITFRLMIELGCCFGLKHNPAMSANYFKQALSEAVVDTNNHNMKQAALLLGSARMADGKEELAVNAMKEHVVPFWMMDWLPGLLEHPYAREPYIARALGVLADFYLPEYGSEPAAHVLEMATTAYDAAIAMRESVPHDLFLEAAHHSMKAGTCQTKANKLIEAKGSFLTAMRWSEKLDDVLTFRAVIAHSTLKYRLTMQEEAIMFAIRRLPPHEIMEKALREVTTGPLGTTRSLYVFLLKFAYELRKNGYNHEAKIVYGSMIPAPLKHAQEILMTSLEKAACFLGIDRHYDVRNLLKYQPRQDNAALDDLLSQAAALARDGHLEEARTIYKKVEGPDSLNAAEVEEKMRKRSGRKKG